MSAPPYYVHFKLATNKTLLTEIQTPFVSIPKNAVYKED